VLAAILLATAVTIHPVAWVPVACAPFVLLLRTGRHRERVVTTLGSAALIAVAGAAIAAGPVLSVLHGQLGSQWGHASPHGARLVWLAALLPTPWIAGLAWNDRRARWLVPAVLLVATTMLDGSTNLFGWDTSIAPARAWHLLYRTTALAALLVWLARAGSIARRRSPRAPAFMAAIVGGIALLHAAATFRASTTLPTDALEARAFAPWLQLLPQSARVFYLRESGMMDQALPVYQCEPRMAQIFGVETSQPPVALAPGDYWFRSATCSTSMSRHWCDEVEQRVSLRPVHVERFAARPSLPHLPYDAPEVVSGLYRVESIREP
jgi:hypothetical protein